MFFFCYLTPHWLPFGLANLLMILNYNVSQFDPTGTRTRNLSHMHQTIGPKIAYHSKNSGAEEQVTIRPTFFLLIKNDLITRKVEGWKGEHHPKSSKYMRCERRATRRIISEELKRNLKKMYSPTSFSEITGIKRRIFIKNKCKATRLFIQARPFLDAAHVSRLPLHAVP